MTSATEAPPTVSLLRIATAGSVDDGKSTLVGRLLHDTKSVLADQLAAVEQVSRDRGLGAPDLALLTDGLRAEREQGITIDVAYRYFATARRRFILADTPGHVQYTRNMVTGASTADLGVILVDARHGLVEQTRRHAAIAALLRVPRTVLAVNKMDLVGWSESRFAELASEFTAYTEALGAGTPTVVPVSALTGDNVVEPSSHMGWYDGPTLLGHLEGTPAGTDVLDCPFRFPVQYVIRTHYPEYRGYTGQITAGTIRVGDPVAILPSGRITVVSGIDLLGEPVDMAWAPQSVSLRLAAELDVSRGALIVATTDRPEVTQEVEATVCHLDDRPLVPGARVLVRHGTRTVRGRIAEIPSRLGLADLRPETDPGALVANDIGHVVVRTAAPLPVNNYADCRRTGSFLLVDPVDGATLTAGMVGTAFAGRGGAPAGA